MPIWTMLCGVVLSALLLGGPAAAQHNNPLPLFAVEIRIGTKWDTTKPAQEQPYFREHSQNLRRLRDAGSLVMGARYGEVGLVVLAATDAAAARAMMDADPSIEAGTFRYTLHPFSVFYGGTLAPRAQPAAPR